MPASSVVTNIASLQMNGDAHGKLDSKSNNNIFQYENEQVFGAPQ